MLGLVKAKQIICAIFSNQLETDPHMIQFSITPCQLLGWLRNDPGLYYPLLAA